MSSPLPQGESLRFNSPPNWPAPPAGWTPPRGWVPDPSWPLPPAGWPLWIADPGAADTFAGRGAEAGARMSRRRRRQRERRFWPGVVAAAVVAALVGGGLGYLQRLDAGSLQRPDAASLHLPDAGSQNWYAAGKDFEVAWEQQDAGLLIGPTSLLTKMCTADLGAAKPGQRPSAADKAAVQQWMQGCEAGYRQEHPDQLIQDGTMYGNGTQPCTGACSSRWYAAGKSVALAASALPGLGPDGGTSGSAASDWCADLMFDRFSQPLPVSVESQLQANMPGGGPETGYWDQGCEAAYRAALNPLPSYSAVTATGVFGTALAASATLLPAAYHRDEHAPIHGCAPLAYIMPSWIT